MEGKAVTLALIALAIVVFAILAMRESPAIARARSRASTSSGNSGCSSTFSQNSTHSRSFCRPSITVPPSPVGNGP